MSTARSKAKEKTASAATGAVSTVKQILKLLLV
uniref:Uncharacterized protein n=1 Tax=Siphoviridae sp. ctQkj3 TaxID=2825495 RepID=A0A8S5TVV3_9CAUD|nr:MAG TPA: hypothetical protein [Siphoviridae sp. ctQkj3]